MHPLHNSYTTVWAYPRASIAVQVDKSALEQQVDEKRAREQAERDRDA